VITARYNIPTRRASFDVALFLICLRLRRPWYPGTLVGGEEEKSAISKRASEARHTNPKRERGLCFWRISEAIDESGCCQITPGDLIRGNGIMPVVDLLGLVRYRVIELL
jgi:hypothetical protein